MLCADTKPVFEARTDFGDMLPVMVFSNFSFVASDVTCAKAGVKIWRTRAITMAHLTEVRIVAIYRVISCS